MLIMRNDKADLVAIGPVAMEYQAAVMRDELEDSSTWTSVGIARILTETQAREVATPGTGNAVATALQDRSLQPSHPSPS